ncbi:MAG: PspA/IM30 family protein [Hahellaceae bacterium]|nr:PspA/IM30 family protein [Hahellaceae bacterium]
MNIISKLSSALRASVRESGEVLVDKNEIRIFEQEILDAEKGIQLSKVHLSQVIAERYQLEREKSHVEKLTLTREKQAGEAMAKAEDSLAEEIAEDILQKQENILALSTSIASLIAREKKITANIQAAVMQTQKYRRELIMARAVSSAGKAATLAGGNAQGLNGTLADLKDSASRIKSRQTRFDDSLQAMQEIDSQMGEGSLDAKIKAAGVNDRKEKVRDLLLQLKAKSTPVV